MAQITWKGEEGTPDGAETTWNRLKLKKGEAVDCDDPYMYDKAKGNPYFEVSGERPKDPEKAVTYRPVTQTSAQGPVPKPTEPVNPEAEKESQPKWPKI